ncbi:MAG TPA: hypothetical protein ENI33_08875 [Thermoplasmatales archaeon]|nr:hypothetical protein [Thermoplasmatales archaeon]
MMYKPYGLNLLPEEKILWIGKRSLKSLWLFFVVGFVLLPLYGVGIIFIIYAIVSWLRSDYVLTNERILKVRRRYAFVYLLSYDIEEMKREDLESIYTIQSSMGRVLNYWDVVIENSKKIVFKGVREPEVIKKILKG